MDWQQTIVILIGILVAVVLLRRVLRFFCKRGRNGCGACESDCPLRDLRDAKRRKRP